MEQKKISKNNIGILCSENSRKIVGDYYRQLRGTELPVQINLVTSAYFSGFDLEKKFHLISISSNVEKIYASLSEHRLKQIAGRCRVGLYSETVVYNIGTVSKNLPQSKAELVMAAEKEVKALNCITSNYLSNSILKDNLKQIRDLIITNTRSEGYQLVRRKYDHELTVSYLNIDALLESHRVHREVYKNKNSLYHILKNEGHNITRKDHVSKTDVINHDLAAIIRKQEVDEIIKQLNILKIFEVRSLVDLPLVQKRIVDAYLMNILYVDKDQLLKKLKDAGYSRDSRALSNTRLGIIYCTFHPDNNYKRNVNRQIVVGKTYTSEELLIQWNRILEDSAMQKKLVSEVTATRITNLHFTVIRKKTGHHIVSINPFIKVIKHRPGQESTENLADILFNEY